MNDGIIYCFYTPAFETFHSLTNSEEYARHYAEKNFERVIVFALDSYGRYV